MIICSLYAVFAMERNQLKKDVDMGQSNFARKKFTNFYIYESINNEDEKSGFYDIPIIKGVKLTKNDFENVDFLPFSSDRQGNFATKNNAVHFFIDDYRFSNIWRNPARYIKKFQEYKFVLTPDFSQYLDISRAERIFNAYKRQLIGFFWKKNNVNIIPTVCWDDESSYIYSIDCIENGTAVALSTVGIKTDKEIELFINGFNYLKNIIEPCFYVIYGGNRDFLPKIEHDKLHIIEPFYKNIKKGS